MAIRNKRNEVTLIGRVYDFERTGGRAFAEKVSKKGNTYIGGRMYICTDEDGLNVIPVDFVYVTPTVVRKGQESRNNVYTTLKTIIDSGRTWKDVGKDNAIMVSVEEAISVNDWYNGTEIVSTPVIESTFAGGRVSILTSLPVENERNEFRADVVISGTTLTEADPDRNIPETYLILRCGTFNFREELLPFNVIVKHPKAIEYFLDQNITSKNPLYTGIRGYFNYSTIVDKQVVECAWGTAEEAAVDTRERKVREWICYHANTVPYDFIPDADEEEAKKALTTQDLITVIQNREIKLAEVKKSAEERAAAATPSNNAAPAIEVNTSLEFNY